MNRLAKLAFLLVLLNTIVYGQLKEFEVRESVPPPVIPLFPNNPDDAALIIYSSIPNLGFESNTAGIVDIKTDQGKYILILKTEKQSILIKAVNYIENRLLVPRLNAKQVKYYRIEEAAKELKEFPINILTSPANARIYIDGKLKGTKTTQMISAGVHEIKLELEGYRVMTAKIEVSSTGNTLFEYSLEKLRPSIITMKSIPEAATIFVNNKDQGLTDKQLFLTEGTYKIRLTKYGYNEIDTTLSVEQNGNREYVFNLKKEGARLTVKVNPADAKLELDQKVVRNLKDFDMAPGMHYLDVSREGYEPFYEAIEVSGSEPIIKEINLKPIYGSIQISVQPINAQVKLSNKTCTHKWTGSNRLDTIIVGNYDLEITADGHNGFFKNIAIAKDILYEEQVKLEPLTGQGLAVYSPDNILRNLTCNEEGGRYIINYDLTGDAAEDYNVEICLTDKSGTETKLKYITGSIGTGKFVGGNNKIYWEYQKDISGKFNTNGLSLKLTAEKAGGSTWYYYALGAVVAGGISAAVILGKSSESVSSGDQTKTVTIPVPPDRP